MLTFGLLCACALYIFYDLPPRAEATLPVEPARPSTSAKGTI